MVTVIDSESKGCSSMYTKKYKDLMSRDSYKSIYFLCSASTRDSEIVETKKSRVSHGFFLETTPNGNLPHL